MKVIEHHEERLAILRIEKPDDTLKVIYDKKDRRYHIIIESEDNLSEVVLDNIEFLNRFMEFCSKAFRG